MRWQERRGRGAGTGWTDLGLRGNMKEFWFEPQKDRKPQRVKQGTFILIMFVFPLKDHVV